MRYIAGARVEEIFEHVDRELKLIKRSKKLPGGVTLVGGSSKIPGMVDFAKDVLELPARIGSFKHVNRVISGMDDQIFAPAAGLMLLDMLLGPPQSHSYSESEPGFLKQSRSKLNKLFTQFKRS